MAAVRGRPASFQSSAPVEEPAPVNDLMFFALPAPLFQELSKAAAARQMSLSELLSVSVSEYLAKPYGKE